MSEKNFSKIFQISKIIQFCIFVGLEILFFVVLFCNPSLSKQLYSNKTLLILCALFWVFMVFMFLCFLCDFFHLKRFAVENHALNKAAYLDTLTGIPNRHGLDMVFQTYDTPESFSSVGCLLTTITNLKEINETRGHQSGDVTIQGFCSIFEKVGDAYGVVGRNSGNEYVLIINNCSDLRMKQFIEDLNHHLEEYNKDNSETPIRVKHAYILNSEMKAETFIQLLAATYNKLHA